MTKYTKEERLNIAKRIYEGELTVAEAANEYDISFYTARDYLRFYKSGLPKEERENHEFEERKAKVLSTKLYGKLTTNLADKDYETLIREIYGSLDREELIDQLVMMKMRELKILELFEAPAR